MKGLRWRRLYCIGLIASAAIGCKMGPDYQRPFVPLPADYRGSQYPDIASGTSDSIGALNWRNVFTDPVLQDLIVEGLHNNQDIRIAADRVAEQEANLGVTAAAEYPTLNAGGTALALKLPSRINQLKSGSGGNGGSPNLPTRLEAGGLTWSAMWNVDVWGYYRRQTEAARAELRATKWAQESAYSNIVQNVATGYYQLRALDEELRIANDTIKARKDSLDLTRKLEEAGTDTLADVSQAEESYYTALGDVPGIEKQIEQQENSLAYTLGRSPSRIERGTSIVNVDHPIVPAGLPADILRRRPDVQRAEEMIHQANANVGVAKAQFFPQISLSDSGGIVSNQLKGITESKNLYTYAIGSLSEPIFDAGKLIANYHLSKAQYQEMVDTYQQTVSAALRDVSNALVAYQKTRESRELAEKLAASSANAVGLSRMRFGRGSVSYLEVLTNDTDLYNARLSVESAELQEALALVQLYNALGGGW